MYGHIVYFGVTASRSSEVVGNADADMCVAPLKQTNAFQGNQLFQSVDHDSVFHIIAVEHPSLDIREATVSDIGCRHLRITNLQQCFQGQIGLYQCILVKNNIYILRIVVGQDDRFRQVIGTDRKIQRLPVAPHDKLIQFRTYHRTVVPDTMPNDKNAVILKGGKESKNTNKKIMEIINKALETVDGFPKNVVQQVFSRDDVAKMLKCDEYINLIIPRGGNNLVKFIKNNTKIPVLGHASGICHIFVDESADSYVVLVFFFLRVWLLL